jgi:hypothetical protein
MARARAEAHLASCAECRATLERSIGLEHTLRDQLAKDPGDAYFRDFASRIEARIRPAGARQLPSKAPPGEGLWTWLNSPVGMSWAGAAAVLVVGAGVSWITMREISRPTLHGAAATSDQVVAAPPSTSSTAGPVAATPPPAETSTPPEDQTSAQGGAAANGSLADEQPANPAPAAAPSRAMEVKQGPSGENILTDRRQSFTPAAPPPAPAALKGSAPVHVRKSATVQPMASSSSAAKDEVSRKSHSAAARAGSTGGPLAATQSAPSLRLGNSPGTAGQRCGAVRDAAGHPVAGAQLMLVETGSSAQSHSDGSFCLDLTAAARTLVVMAVGFEAQRITLDPTDPSPLTLTLRGVSVVGGTGAGTNPGTSAFVIPPGGTRWVHKPGSSGEPSGGATYRPTPVGSTEAFASLSDSVRSMTLKAFQVENDAARAQSADQFRLAAEEWQKVLRHTADTAAENETRFRIAGDYYRAWQIDPSHPRSMIALEAITSFMLRAPTGPERDQASMWLGQLRWGDSKN